MRILFVIHYPIFGGPHNQALRLNSTLASSGWQTTVLLPDEPGAGAARLRAGGVDVVQQPLHRLRAKPNPRVHAALISSLPREVEEIRRLIRDRNIDIVVVAGLANPHAALAARREGVPVVWQILDTYAPPILRFVLMRFVRQLADAVMFTGQALARLHAPTGHLPMPQFVYFPPVDVASFHPSPERRSAVRRELGIPHDGLVVGMVAHIAPQKGIENFVRAASILHVGLSNVWFFIVGGRVDTQLDYAKSVEEEVDRSGIPKTRLIFTGERSDIERYYPAMDVKLITSRSRSEGIPTTAMEALACGVPVVATDVGAIGEVVKHRVTGTLVGSSNPQALADATRFILDDNVLRSRMGHVARQYAVEAFAPNICAGIHVRAFEAAMSHHLGRARHRNSTIAS